MKKTWENPELKNLGVKSTEHGPHTTENHDMTTYDSAGDWWAGGIS